MSGRTSIEWTDHSSNPLRAYHRDTGKRGWFCVHVSPGCANCYAGRRNRWIGNGLHYSAQNEKLVRFEMDEAELRSWARLKAGTKVFPFDMTDLFQDGVPDHLIDRAFGAMAWARQATFQVLTKRSKRLQKYSAGLERLSRQERAYRMVRSMYLGHPAEKLVTSSELSAGSGMDWPLPNVWLGVSVEDRDRLLRIDHLKDTPAAVRFVSFEPLLEHLGAVLLDGIHWAIIGGESGPRSRALHISWIRYLLRGCRDQGVAPFVKQLGSLPVIGEAEWRGLERQPLLSARKSRRAPAGHVALALGDSKGGDAAEWPVDLRVREFPAVRS